MARTGRVAAKPRSAGGRQDQLLDEAARQINARGVLLASLTDIADGLAVSRAALYYYVQDREDLVFKVYRRSLEILGRHLGEATRSSPHALEVVRALISSTLDPSEPEIAALSEIGLLRSADRETVLAMYEGVVARLASVLAAGAAACEVRVCDFEVAARCIISTIYWIPLAARWSAAPPVERRRVIALVSELAEIGIATRREPVTEPARLDLGALTAPAITSLDRGTLGAVKRETILLAASRLFNSKGVDTTSLDEIAAALGTNKRTLYRYVGDKQAIVAACYERAFRIAIAVSDQASALRLSAAQQFDAQHRAYALVQQDRDICPLRPLIGFEALSAEARFSVASLAGQLAASAKERLSRAQRDGEIRDIELDEMLPVVAGPSAWLAKELVESSPARQLKTADEVADFIRLGLAPV